MMIERDKCPICGKPNDCTAAKTGRHGECWCMNETFPKEVFDLVPEHLKRQACICKDCLAKAKQELARKRPASIPRAGDFYIEGANIIFTAQYLLRRGYCCGNGCRHCPYEGGEKSATGAGRK